MSVILSNKLSVHDIATKSLHSYPSHGYLLYRACLALSFGTVWGQLIALGPIGKHLARVGQCIATIISPMQKFARLLLKKNEHIINAIKRKSRSIRHQYQYYYQYLHVGICSFYSSHETKSLYFADQISPWFLIKKRSEDTYHFSTICKQHPEYAELTTTS